MRVTEKRAIGAVTALLWLPSLTTLAAAKEPASYVKAMGLVRERKYHEAVVYLDLALSQKPDHVRAFDHLAKCHVRLGNFATARDVLDRLASTAPSHRMTAGLEAKMIEQYLHCAGRLQRGDEAALEDMQTIASARTARTDVRAHAALAIASFCYSHKQLARAARAYDQVRQQADHLYDHGVPVRHLRSLLMSQQRVAALDLYPKLSDQLRDPYLEEAQKVLVECVLQHAREVAHLHKPTRLTLRGAHDTFARGLSVLPEGSKAKASLDQELAEFEVEMGRALKAEGEGALKAKDSALANHCVADVLELATRCEPGTRLWAQSVKADLEEEAHKMYIAGVRLLSDRDYQAALSQLRRAPMHYPRTKGAWKALWYMGQAYGGLNKPELAFQCHEKAFKLYPNSPGLCNVCYKLGQYYEGKKNWRAAARAYEHALEYGSTRINADMCGFLLTLLHWERKDYAQTKQTGERFLKLFPDSSLRKRVGLMIRSSDLHLAANRRSSARR